MTTSTVEHLPPEEYTMQTVMGKDAFTWARRGGLILQGGVPFELNRHQYQFDIMIHPAKRQCAKKAAQKGFTEINVIRTLHGMIHKTYPKGVLYLFPTSDDVTDFSKGRFSTMIEDNPILVGQYVRNTDAANIKRICDAMLYLRGARSTRRIEGTKKTSSKLKAVPVDKIVYDECDEMDPDMITLAQERLSHSEIQEEFFLSTPTVPDFGIDKYYNDSDQRIWMIKCRKCGTETCLELEFPECLFETSDGQVLRVCKKCRQKIHPRHGRWVAQYPEREKDMVGWWISQLNSCYVNPKAILDMYRNPPNGDLSELYNSKLGMAYVAAENRLTKHEVHACCSKDAMAINHDGPCAMGVDVGKNLHVTIGCNEKNGISRLLKTTTVTDFNDVHDLAKRFNVQCAVFDLYPETRKVREFAANEPYAVFGCDYQESARGAIRWDEKNHIVTVNRTEICDATHDLVVGGTFVIPRKSSEIEEYAKHMCNIAKVLEGDKETGSRVYRYRKLGDNHYRHSTNYLYMALQEIGTVYDKDILNKIKKRRKKRGFMAR